MKILAKPIKVIAAFDEKGALIPRRFKIEEEGLWRLINVDKIISTESVRPAGMDALVFLCQSEIRGALRQYELIYRIKAHQWELYKM